jgi:hypothetical protein
MRLLLLMSLAVVTVGCKGAADSTIPDWQRDVVYSVKPGDTELTIEYHQSPSSIEWSLDSAEVAPERLLDELKRRIGQASGPLHVVVWHPKNKLDDPNPTLDAIRDWSKRPNVVYREDFCRGHVRGVTFGKEFKR